MKKILFTCRFGDNLDSIKQPKTATPGWHYHLFTDQDISDTGVWEVQKISKGAMSIMGPKLTSRYFKTGAPPNGDVVVYVDATYLQIGDLDEFVKDLGDGVHMTPHPQRDCLYLEAEVVKAKKLDKFEVVDRQVEKYFSEGYPTSNGLFRCGVIVRIGDTSKFDKQWWQEIKENSWRDQISCPYSAWRSGTTIQPLPHGHVERHFRPHLHNPRQMRGVLINPKDVDKNKWVYEGEPDERIYDAVERYPKTHCIKFPNGIMYQGWLRDYLPDLNRMVEHVKIYRGTYAIYL